jgi:hypothetical protein
MTLRRLNFKIQIISKNLNYYLPVGGFVESFAGYIYQMAMSMGQTAY